MVKLPKRVRVVGKDYGIQSERENSLGSNRSGEANHKQLLITIDAEWHPEQQRECLFHELHHCVEWATGLELKEREVYAMSAGMFQVLRDNPAVRRWIFPDE